MASLMKELNEQKSSLDALRHDQIVLHEDIQSHQSMKSGLCIRYVLEIKHYFTFFTFFADV